MQLQDCKAENLTSDQPDPNSIRTSVLYLFGDLLQKSAEYEKMEIYFLHE